VNDWLADGVRAGQEQAQIDILGQRKVDTNGVEEGGEGRVVRLSRPIEMSELEARIKKHLKLSQSKSANTLYIFFSPNFQSTQTSLVVQVGYSDRSSKLIQSVAMCAGSGGAMLLGRDADVYFTGEMSHVRFESQF